MWSWFYNCMYVYFSPTLTCPTLHISIILSGHLPVILKCKSPSSLWWQNQRFEADYTEQSSNSLVMYLGPNFTFDFVVKLGVKEKLIMQRSKLLHNDVKIVYSFSRSRKLTYAQYILEWRYFFLGFGVMKTFNF